MARENSGPSSVQNHSHPIGGLAKAQKKSGWHGSLTLPLGRGDKKKHQTNRIQTECPGATLQSDSAAFNLETCRRDWGGFDGTNFQSLESHGVHALCTTDPCDRPKRCLRRARTAQRSAFGHTRGDLLRAVTISPTPTSVATRRSLN